MATTSIWRVKGWLGKVVIYAENPEKTANPKFYADRELTEQDGQQLSDVIRYAVNSEKTQETGTEDGAPLVEIPSETTLTLMLQGDTWCRVRWEERQIEGYCLTRYLT